MPRKPKIKYIIGVDEAGRGPLAGPIAFGAFLIENKKIDNRKLKFLFKGARDSKKMTARKREEIFAKIKRVGQRNLVEYVVVMQSARSIDSRGLSWVINDCIGKCLKKLGANPKETLVLLDGGIKAPKKFIFQKTIIRGDDTELVISLASICAKVTRDAHMMELSKKYPKYGLDKHKGYGTLTHRVAIKRHGPSPIHRKTFLKRTLL